MKPRATRAPWSRTLSPFWIRIISRTLSGESTRRPLYSPLPRIMAAKCAASATGARREPAGRSSSFGMASQTSG